MNSRKAERWAKIREHSTKKTATTSRREQILCHSTALVLEYYKSGAAFIVMVHVSLGFTLAFTLALTMNLKLWFTITR